MYEQDECIFCFEIFSPKKNYTNFDKNDILSCETYIKNILNDTLTLKCKHDFHIGCFIKYIVTKYTSWKKKQTLDYIDIFHVPCPFCRTLLKNEELLSILDYLTHLKTILDNISNILLKLKFRMRLIKLSVYSRKLLSMNINTQYAYDYLKITETYENWEFLHTKIKFIIKDTDLLYETLLKSKSDEFISREEDNYRWFF